MSCFRSSDRESLWTCDCLLRCCSHRVKSFDVFVNNAVCLCLFEELVVRVKFATFRLFGLNNSSNMLDGLLNQNWNIQFYIKWKILLFGNPADDIQDVEGRARDEGFAFIDGFL